jgi:hypothetical protein
MLLQAGEFLQIDGVTSFEEQRKIADVVIKKTYVYHTGITFDNIQI